MSPADLVNALTLALRIAEAVGLREAKTIAALIEQVSVPEVGADSLTVRDDRTKGR